jgi:hypothetical protein
MPGLNIAAGQMLGFSTRVLPPVNANAADGKRVVVTRLASWRPDRFSTNVTWEMLGETLEPFEPALQTAVKALALPEFNANPDYYSGWGTLLPHLSRLHYLHFTFQGAALHRLHGGRLDEGVELMAGHIRLAATLKDEACTISQLTRLAMAPGAFATTWQAVHADGLNEAHLKELRRLGPPTIF